jgi:putative transcriptional regulator
MSIKIGHHPDAATLMSYAAGTLAEPLAAVIAAHVSMCPHCQEAVADIELMGAALLLGGSACSPEDRARPARRPQDGARPPARLEIADDRLPRTIVAAYGLSFATIPWRRLGPGVWHHRLALSKDAEGDLRFLKIGPGRAMPDHGHGGSELTLVLDGAYSDETGEFRPGDVQDVDETIEHTPVSDARFGCVCLIASERPARFKGMIGRLLQPWTGM